MLVKIVAIILVVGSCTMIGFLLAKRYGQRVRELRMINSALKHIETEIVYGLTPLPNAFYQIAMRMEEPVRSVFSLMSERFHDHDLSTAEIWQNSWEVNQSKLALKKRDYDILFQLGHSLGQTDRDNQVKHIGISLSYIQAEEEGARLDQQKNEKMYQYLGFLTGIMIVILMV